MDYVIGFLSGIGSTLLALVWFVLAAFKMGRRVEKKIANRRIKEILEDYSELHDIWLKRIKETEQKLDEIIKIIK